MSRWRTVVILMFLIAPILFFVGVGTWALWETGRLVWLWLVIPVGWAVALLLAKLWGERILPLRPEEIETEIHWTPRDKQAWEFVEARIRSIGDIDSEDFTRLQFYIDVAQGLAEEIARHYHPKATDPFSSLTVPEIMAAGQLALEDMSEMYDDYVPGGHLLTIQNMRSISKFPKRYKMFANIATAAVAIFNPLAAVGRYAASKTIMEPVTRAMQSNVLTWFYTLFLQRVGFYLIEMNSGRLRGGSKKFRKAFERLNQSGQRPWDQTDDSTIIPPVSNARDAERTDVEKLSPAHEEEESQTSVDRSPSATDEITICVLGQTGSGKTSVIRGLLNDADAEPERSKKSPADVFRMGLPGGENRLRFLDTDGYGGDGGSRSGRKERFRAVAESDLVLLITSAAGPARDVDVGFLQEMADWFESQPQFKPPPVIAVLTHIDLLKPPLEWNPPYNWRESQNLKERSIHDAVEHVRQEFGDRVRQVVPLCSDVENQRVFGIQEELVPATVAALEEAQAVSTVRQLHKEIDTGKVSRVLNQVWNIGKALRGK